MMDEVPKLPQRPVDGHKGTFGTVCVIGGQTGGPRVMLGGPAFAALGALRAGAGLAVLAVPAPLLAESLTVAPSATGLALPVDEQGHLRASAVAALLDEFLQEYDCVAIGPGFGADEPQRQVVMRLIGQDDVPLVVDADALNALAAVVEFHRDFRAPAVLTPHPGEYRRLAAALDLNGDPVDAARRPAAAEQLAQRLGCVVVLKGAATIVTDGVQTWSKPSGNVALATAGTGDVLTGVIAGFVGQFFKPHAGASSSSITPRPQESMSLYDCARLGVYVHGLAADRWAQRHGQAGLLATDLLTELPGAIAQLRTTQ